MKYILRKWPILIRVENYEQENTVHKFLDMFELEYEWREDDTVRIITTDPSQVLYLKKRGIKAEYEKANMLPEKAPLYSDPLLE